MTKLILVRGLPGSGKSTLGTLLGHSIAADDYFVDEEGTYKFDPPKLPTAHAWCLIQTEIFLKMDSIDTVVVCNTFTQRWELQPYLELAGKLEVQVTVVDLYDGGCTDQELFQRNIHGVPLEAFERMRSRYEFDWKNGDPRKPWERGAAK